MLRRRAECRVVEKLLEVGEREIEQRGDVSRPACTREESVSISRRKFSSRREDLKLTLESEIGGKVDEGRDAPLVRVAS